MERATLKLKEECVIDADGKQVILNRKAYEELLEDYQDLLAIVEAQKEPPIPWEEAKKELRRDGLL